MYPPSGGDHSIARPAIVVSYIMAMGLASRLHFLTLPGGPRSIRRTCECVEAMRSRTHNASNASTSTSREHELPPRGSVLFVSMCVSRGISRPGTKFVERTPND